MFPQNIFTTIDFRPGAVCQKNQQGKSAINTDESGNISQKKFLALKAYQDSR